MVKALLRRRKDKDIVRIRKPYVLREGLPPNGHWSFTEIMNANGSYCGFVYGVRNRLNGKMYLGRKQYMEAGPKGKQMSDWKTYTTSNREIDNLARTLLGSGVPVTDLFDMVVLEEYRTIGTLCFAEVWCIVTAETPANKNLFYNTLINGVSWHIKEQISQRNRDRLKAFLLGELK